TSAGERRDFRRYGKLAADRNPKGPRFFSAIRLATLSGARVRLEPVLEGYNLTSGPRRRCRLRDGETRSGISGKAPERARHLMRSRARTRLWAGTTRRSPRTLRSADPASHVTRSDPRGLRARSGRSRS